MGTSPKSSPTPRPPTTRGIPSSRCNGLEVPFEHREQGAPVARMHRVLAGHEPDVGSDCAKDVRARPGQDPQRSRRRRSRPRSPRESLQPGHDIAHPPRLGTVRPTGKPVRSREEIRGGTRRFPHAHRGAEIRTPDLSDPNGARYQAAPHPERAKGSDNRAHGPARRDHPVRERTARNPPVPGVRHARPAGARRRRGDEDRVRRLVVARALRTIGGGRRTARDRPPRHVLAERACLDRPAPAWPAADALRSRPEPRGLPPRARRAPRDRQQRPARRGARGGGRAGRSARSAREAGCPSPSESRSSSAASARRSVASHSSSRMARNGSSVSRSAQAEPAAS